MEALARLAVRRPVAVSVVAAALVILGYTAWNDLPLDLLPDIQSPTIVVSIRSGDRPPSEMERLYGEQVEQRLFAVRGIKRIDQVARTGRIIGTVIFDWDADMDFALVEVEKAVGPIRSDPDVDEVLVRRFDPRQAPVITLGLTADEKGPDLSELRRAARRQVAIALERLEGVAEARVTGGRDKEIRVLVDRYKMDALGVTLAELQARLRDANVDINAGTLEEGSRVFLVRGMARYRKLEDIERVVIRYTPGADDRPIPVHVSDVARVEFADVEITHLVRVDGVEGVGIAIYKEAGANTVEVSSTVREALEEIERDLPGVSFIIVADEAALVQDAIGDVEQAALIGVALAVLVLALFLRSLGPTVIVATAVPVSLLGTLFLMHFAGQSLNIMTLGGLALGAGMLVDNAIVVVEAIFRRLAGKESLEDSAARGTADVAGAIVASTLTTCAVFLPIVFVRGLAARLISGLSFGVVVSLLVSLVVAVFVIPALAGWLLPRTSPPAVDPGKGRTEGVVYALLGQPLAVVFIGVVLAAGGIWGLTRLGSELLPPSDPRQFSVRLTAPPGTRVEATEQVVDGVERILREATGEDLVAILSEVGRLPEDDRLIREEQTEENTARISVRLRAGGPSGSQVVAAAAPAVAALDRVEASWEVGASALSRALGTAGPPILVEISGQSLEELRLGAERVRDSMAAQSALWNVRSSFEGGPPELRIRLDRTLADGLGVDLDLVATALQASLDGKQTTVVTMGDEERDVVMRTPRMRRDELLHVPLTTPSGARVVVGDVATLEPQSGAREIFRRDQRRVARVTARVADGADYPAAQAAAAAGLEAAELPPGLVARVAGEEEERTQTFRELRFAALLALMLVFMVLAGTFESLIHPLTIAIAIPLALVGVAAILIPVGRPIGVMEMLGMIVLSGVAVNDAILYVDRARQLIAEGLDKRRALARAASLRFRPIMMTTATTVLALAPLAIGAGEAARLRSPLALTIIGGIIASTAGCLLVIPCVYSLLDRLRLRRSRA
ncbi:MAG: MMPL family transporter [Acidobacteria bacterium]|nr:MMPL family transporter [Acidobacteriota bacterium]NIM61875.1 MMPL family transporter [Acidobacteriota bacterium]NIO60832.1 MMPL family transporter [Acidobacteriota bacterium]NIQ31907.1 MMPL family transporter [Acidobacteriota bacterium]NIQ87284.1 MMPL family transporter [Acidobacteriota bacterium]